MSVRGVCGKRRSISSRLFTFLRLALLLDSRRRFGRLLAHAVLPLVSGSLVLAVVLCRLHLFLLVIRLSIFVALARDHLGKKRLKNDREKQQNWLETKS